MECNRDEAVRAKEMAEKKLLEKDVVGAKKLALKAQNLFPTLEGLSQFLEIVDVYIALEERINGELNYYGVLGVDPFADEELLKKQYRRKALSLHPDKNKFVGADGAFVILSQAWSIISDKEKRSAYDTRLNIQAPTNSQPCSSSSHNPVNMQAGTHFQHPTTHPWTPPVVGSRYAPPPCYPGSTMHAMHASSQYRPPLDPTPPTAGQQCSSSNPSLFPIYHRTPPPPAAPTQLVPGSRPHFRSRFVPGRNQPTPSSRQSEPQTFWTLCSRCRVQYEHKKIFLNQNLLCYRCNQPFLATEMPAPNVNNRRPIPPEMPAPNVNNRRPVPPHQQGVAAPSSDPESMARSTNRPSQAAFVQPCVEPVQRRHEETNMENSSARPENMGTGPVLCTVSGCSKEKTSKRRRRNSQRSAARSGLGERGFSGDESMKEVSQIEIRAMLIGKAKSEILQRLNEWKPEKSDSSHPKKVDKKDMTRKHIIKDKNVLPRDCNSTSQPPNSSTAKEAAKDAPEEFVSMVVPDANFHNFDDDRVEESFAEGQAWAAYDDDDGMPRYYGLIHHVISRNPFKVQISWLKSKTSSEFGPLDWIASGFYKTAGDFRIGKSEVNERLNSFSHPIKWRKGQRGVIQIFPTKGDVWALYRNWSPDWDENTEDETVHKYDPVLVLEDYTEDKGVLICPLVKVAGFTSVFKQVLDQKKHRTIPREEMFRFSHQVPLYRLNGLEAENAPKDCYELDPAALPLELLKVMTDAELASQAMVEPTERSISEGVKHMLTYSRRNKGKKVGGIFFQSLQSTSLDAC